MQIDIQDNPDGDIQQQVTVLDITELVRVSLALFDNHCTSPCIIS